MSGKLIAVYLSTHETLKAEKLLKEAGIKIRTMVKPRIISSDCQLALSFPEGSLEDVKKVTEDQELDLTGYFREDADGEWVEA